MLGDNPLHRGSVTDIPLDKYITRIAGYVLKILQVASIGKLIVNNYLVVRILVEDVMNKVGPDKPCPTGDKKFIQNRALLSQ